MLSSPPSLRKRENVRPYRIHYDERCPYSGRGLSPHGVYDIQVMRDYRAAIKRGHTELGKMAWRPLQYRVVPVHIYAIPGNYLGLATPASPPDPPYLELTCLGSEPEAAAAKRRRQASAVHEMTHLYQFEYEPPRHWLWLGEASATAMESHVYSKSADYFRYLARWFTRPEEPVDSGDGYECVSFVIYLMRRFGPDVVPHAYEAGLGGAARLDPLDALDAALRPSGYTMASLGANDVFASGYCADAYFTGDPTSRMYHPKLRPRFGNRAVAETFTDYPVTGAANDDPIMHLGCRYYRFRPQPGRSRLKVTVRPYDARSKDMLRADLYGVDYSSQRASYVRLTDTTGAGPLQGTLPDFREAKLDHAVLVIANCAWGQGSANYDDLRFTIDAQTV